MDLSFFPKPRVVPFFASFSPSKFYLRQEFLGRGNQLSSSGFRFRRRYSRSGTQILSPRCAVFQDFPFDCSILAVEATITTFTSFCAIYINYSRFRSGDPQLSDEEPSFLTSSIDSTQDVEIVEHETVKSQFSSTEHLYAEPFLYRRMNIVEGTNDYVCSEEVIASDIKYAHPLKFQGPNLKHDDNKFNPGNELPDIETDSALPKVHGGKVLSPSIMVHELNIFVTGALDEAVTASNISSLAIPVEKQVEICQNNEVRHVTAQHGEIPVSDNDSILTQFGGVSFHKEEKQSYVRSISCFKILNSRTMHHILWDMTSFNTRLRPSLKVAAVPPQRSHLTAEYMKQQELVACFKEGPGSKGKETVRDHDFTKIGRGFTHQTDNRNISRFRRPNGEVVKDANGPPAYLRTYNRLLREVRLEDCVDFLESMESKGLLDMDKVHHTRFLKVCKSQKSVEVAFRFSKLIKKPTLSTFNMLLSVCASSQDFDGAFQVMLLTKEAGLKPDCKLYTTLISSCAKCGKVDTMFEVFHEMVNAGVEPNANTYGALIDGCARSGQVAKAFGAYGIMRSKNVQPDRVIFNALITACGQSGAVDRAFDVLAEMTTEPKPIDPDHVTVGALMKTCTQAGQVERVREVYKMLHLYHIRGTPDVYTIAVRSCSHTGDWAFALSIYDDMKSNGLLPDEMFFSTLVDVAGHAGKVDAAFDILEDVRTTGIQLGSVSYSSLMGACCNANKWEKALELYEDIKSSKLIPTVPMLNALLTSLCDGDQLLKSVEVLKEMRKTRVRPNEITYSILIVACEKTGEAELALNLLLKAKSDGILPNLVMCRCLTGLCLQSFEKAYLLGEPVVSFYSGRPQIDSKWTSSAIMVYHQTIAAGVIPSVEVFSQVLGCLKFPRDSSLRDRFVESLGMNFDSSRYSSVCSLLDGFGEYDTRCFSILEEAVSVGVIPRVSIKDNPIFVDARKFHIHTIEVYMLTILKGLKHRLAAGARLPNITVLLPIEKSVIQSGKGERIINLVGRIGQAVVSLMRRLGLPYQGNESLGRIRLNGLTLRRWFKPKLASSSIVLTPTLLGKGISNQQRTIRSGSNLSMEQ